MSAVRDSWMIQVEFGDLSVKTCDHMTFKRKLKGTGVEVDTGYPIAFVGKGRFIGRGFATKRAAKKLSNTFSVSWNSRNSRPLLFKELKFNEVPSQPQASRSLRGEGF